MGKCISFAATAQDRVVLQKPSETVDEYGSRTVSWVTQGSYWAQIMPVSGREVFAQGAIQSRATHKITTRYQEALKDIRVISNYRFSFDGRIFAVLSIKNLAADMKMNGREYQEFMVEENSPDVEG